MQERLEREGHVLGEVRRLRVLEEVGRVLGGEEERVRERLERVRVLLAGRVDVGELELAVGLGVEDVEHRGELLDRALDLACAPEDGGFASPDCLE